MYVDPITQQTFENGTLISCESNPQIVLPLDQETDQTLY